MLYFKPLSKEYRSAPLRQGGGGEGGEGGQMIIDTLSFDTSPPFGAQREERKQSFLLTFYDKKDNHKFFFRHL